jgi:hypothetical protein
MIKRAGEKRTPWSGVPVNTLNTLAAGATAVVQHGLTVAIVGRLIVGQLVSPGAAKALRVDRLK